jgi:hypothetical protein
VAATHCVGARESNDLLVIETHAIKDLSEVLGSLGGVRQSSIGRAVGLVGVVHSSVSCNKSYN